jgi:uncharacterized membrane protein YdbT with pleckstrin-like domain
MSELRYSAHPSPLRIRPFAELGMVAILLLGFLLVIVGRYQWPSILGGAAPGLEQIDGEIVQYVGVALFGLATVILYLWYVPTRFERLGITDDALIYHKGSLTGKGVEIKLGSVRELRLDQTPLQRLVNGCDIAVFAAGDKPVLAVRGLPHPERIQALVKVREIA